MSTIKTIIANSLSSYIQIDNKTPDKNHFETLIQQMKVIIIGSKDIPKMIKWFESGILRISYDIRIRINSSKLASDFVLVLIEFIKLYPQKKTLLEKEIISMINIIYYCYSRNTNSHDGKMMIDIQPLILEITKKSTLTTAIVETIFAYTSFDYDIFEFVDNKEIMLKSKQFCTKLLENKLDPQNLNKLIERIKNSDSKMEIHTKLYNSFQAINVNYRYKYEYWNIYINLHLFTGMMFTWSDLELLITSLKPINPLKYSEILQSIMEIMKIIDKKTTLDIIHYVSAQHYIHYVELFQSIPFEHFTLDTVDPLLKYLTNLPLFKIIYKGEYNAKLLQKIIINNTKINHVGQNIKIDIAIFDYCYKQVHTNLSREENIAIMNSALNCCCTEFISYLMENKFVDSYVDLCQLYSENESDIWATLEILNKYNVKLNKDSYINMLHNLKCVIIEPKDTKIIRLKKFTIYQNEEDSNKDYVEFIESIKNELKQKLNRYISPKECLEKIINSDLDISISNIIRIENWQSRQILYNYLKSTNKIKTVKTVIKKTLHP